MGHPRAQRRRRDGIKPPEPGEPRIGRIERVTSKATSLAERPSSGLGSSSASHSPNIGLGRRDPLRERRGATIDGLLRGDLMLQVCPGEEAIAADRRQRHHHAALTA